MFISFMRAIPIYYYPLLISIASDLISHCLIEAHNNPNKLQLPRLVISATTAFQSIPYSLHNSLCTTKPALGRFQIAAIETTKLIAEGLGNWEIDWRIKSLTSETGLGFQDE